MVSVCRCRCRRAVVNGSLDLAARAIAQHAFLFHLAIQGAAQKLALQRQMNRARGGSVVRRSKGTEQCDYVVTHVRIYLGRIFGAATPLRALVSVTGISNKNPVKDFCKWDLFGVCSL